MFKTLFAKAGHAAEYARFRPTYPESLVAHLVSLCSGRSAAMDMGCGSGQLTKSLSSHFSTMIGVDVSQAQIDAALSKHPNIAFHVGSVDELPSEIADGSCDLITCAQAAHWLDMPKFYAMCDRVLKPKGAVAVVGYGNVVMDDERVQRIVHHFYSETLKGHWAAARHHIDSMYTKLDQVPYPDAARYESTIDKTFTVEGLIGYLRSWSAYQTLREAQPNTPDPLEKVAEDIAQALGPNTTAETEVRGHWPLFALTGTKPDA